MASHYVLVTPSYGTEFLMQTDRLVLSVLRGNTSNSCSVCDYLVRNREFHKPFHQTHDNLYFTTKEQKLYLKSDVNHFYKGEMLPLWISEKENPRKIIGRISFPCIVRGGIQTTTVGYHLDKDCLHKGYMTEALQAACEYAFSELKLHRIQADIMPHNAPSVSCVKRCGFRLSGYNVKYMEIDGRYQDHEMYVLLNEPDENTTFSDEYHRKVPEN